MSTKHDLSTKEGRVHLIQESLQAGRDTITRLHAAQQALLELLEAETKPDTQALVLAAAAEIPKEL